MAEKLMEVPERFRCKLPPKRIMKDPVFKGGKTYERAAILKWMADNGNKVPNSEKVFPDSDVEPNVERESEIQKFIINQIPKIFLFLPKLM